VLGPESEIAPFVFAATIEAVGLIDTASETKLFNDDCMSARSEHRGRGQSTGTYAGSSEGSVTCSSALDVGAGAGDSSTLEAESVTTGGISMLGVGSTAGGVSMVTVEVHS